MNEFNLRKVACWAKETLMNDSAQWLINLGESGSETSLVDGLIPVNGYRHEGRSPEEVVIMDKAKDYGAYAVFFEAGRNGKPPVAQAFVFISDGPEDDARFAMLHQRLWSWGEVPLLYRKTLGLIQLFRCAHEPDFIAENGQPICKPYKTLKIAAAVASDDPWWDATRLHNGMLWDDPSVCGILLSAKKAAHKHLFDAIKGLNAELDASGFLEKHLRRKLLILSLLIAYMEEREILLPEYFNTFLSGATRFFEVLADGEALVNLLAALEDRFNGNVFTLTNADRSSLIGNSQLQRYATLIEGREELDGQLTLWELYSFKDLPVELISNIYQIFVKDADSSIYTPPFLVRLMLDEALNWSRLDRLHERNEIVLDPACGSGVFLVEAYKRMVLHWRSRNDWQRPNIEVLKGLLDKVHGIDLEEGAVELAAFSLCLALCDALEPAAIRSSIHLFPELAGKTLHCSCFFEARERELVKESIGLITGNPPFTSKLKTAGAVRSYERYQKEYGTLPDKQLAYLFLHEAMEMVTEGGALSMLQQYNFLYNQKSLDFRRNFFSKWDVREILDFISIRGLFDKGGADTKVLVVLAEAVKPSSSRQILHATFRRSGRADAEQGFDIDYYDLYWLPRQLVLDNDSVWRADLLGGGRVLDFVDRLKEYRTLEDYIKSQPWEQGEGFIFGDPDKARPNAHVVDKPYIPADALSGSFLEGLEIPLAPNRPMERPRREEIYRGPLLLVHKHMALNHAYWSEEYLTYSHEVFGISAAKGGSDELQKLDTWFTRENQPLQAFITCTSASLLASKATAILSSDILSLPYPDEGTLDISTNERVIVEDIINYQSDLVRLGDDSLAMKLDGLEVLADFNSVFVRQINAIYRRNPLKALPHQAWPGVICQAFTFGDGNVDWTNAEELKGKLDALIYDQQSTSLHVTRIARIYDGNFIFLLKPSRLRYWLRSIALRDADETLCDLQAQGF